MSPDRKYPVFVQRNSYRQRRLRDAARMVPVFGFILWLIPLLWPSEGAEAISNATALQYVFGVWILLILLALFIARRIEPTTDQESEGDDGQL